MPDLWWQGFAQLRGQGQILICNHYQPPVNKIQVIVDISGTPELGALQRWKRKATSLGPPPYNRIFLMLFPYLGVVNYRIKSARPVYGLRH